MTRTRASFDKWVNTDSIDFIVNQLIEYDK